MCIYGANVYGHACCSISVSLYNCVHVQNILKYRRAHQLALEIQKDERASTIQTHNIKRYTVRGQGGVKKRRGDWWVRSMNENKVAGWWDSAAVEQMILTYSWLMASVVFSKGHKADSDGLETGPNGWSELEGVDKNKDFRISIVHLKTRNTLSCHFNRLIELKLLRLC